MRWLVIGTLLLTTTSAHAGEGAFLADLAVYGGAVTKVPGGTVKPWLDGDAMMMGSRGRDKPGWAAGVRAQMHLREDEGANTFLIDVRGGAAAAGQNDVGTGAVAVYGFWRFVHDTRDDDETELHHAIGVGAGARIVHGPGSASAGFVGYRRAGATTGGFELSFGYRAGVFLIDTSFRVDGALGLVAGAGLGVSFVGI